MLTRAAGRAARAVTLFIRRLELKLPPCLSKAGKNRRDGDSTISPSLLNRRGASAYVRASLL